MTADGILMPAGKLTAGAVVRGDMRSLPFASGSMDGVWADGSLHHLPKEALQPALCEVARVLHPSGLFSSMSAERGTFQGFVDHQEGVAGQRWYVYYEADELQAVAEAAKLTVVDRIIGGRSEHSAGFVVLFMRHS